MADVTEVKAEEDVRVSGVGHIVKGVAVGVVGLEHALAPAAIDVVLERKSDAFVVRYAAGVEQAHGAEPRVERSGRKSGERRNSGASGPDSARTAESVYAVAIYQVVNAVVSVIGDVEGTVLADCLLDFQTPFLELGNLGRLVGAKQAGWREVWNVRLDLRERLRCS